MYLCNVQVYIEAVRLEGSWVEGHNDGLIHLDDVEVIIASQCTTIPPDASTSTTITTTISHVTTTPMGKVGDIGMR